MAFEIHKNYPFGCLEDSYTVATGQTINEGQAVYLHETNGLTLFPEDIHNENAGDTETPWMASSNSGSGFMENGGKVQVIKGNCSVWTSYFDLGQLNYNPGDRIYASEAVAGNWSKTEGNREVSIGRYVRTATINGVSMILIDIDIEHRYTGEQQ